MQRVTRLRLTAGLEPAIVRGSRRLQRPAPAPMNDGIPSQTDTTATARAPGTAGVWLPLLGITVAGWAFLAWLAIDMGTPFAQLAMPMARGWTAGNVAAVATMWVVMMVAMMLPSALPMILAFVAVSRRSGEPGRARAFVAAYLLTWIAFAIAGTAAQWLLQRSGLVDPMAMSRSRLLTAVLLLLAGLYQFSPLKRICLRACRTPMGFMIGHWRPGARGAFAMGLRHGWLCLGCCWALMGLLFIGGMMNLAWVAAVSVAVAVEKLAPRGEALGRVMGAALIVAAVARLLLPAS